MLFVIVRDVHRVQRMWLNTPQRFEHLFNNERRRKEEETTTPPPKKVNERSKEEEEDGITTVSE